MSWAENNELMLPVLGSWCADRVFCNKRTSRILSIAQFSTGVPQLWACAKTSIRASNAPESCFFYLSEVSYSCQTWASTLHKQVELLKPILNITEAVIAEAMFYGLFMHEAVSLWQGLSTVTSCHRLQNAWRSPVSDTCGIKKRVIPGPKSRWKTFM